MTGPLIRARHMQAIQPFRVMELLARAKKMEADGRSVIHMEVGEPDFETPRPVIDAGIQALREGRTHYTPAVGDMSLRNTISQYYLDRFDTHVDADRILITPGASGALQLALSVLVNPGDEVVLADPGYPCNRNLLYLLGAIPVAVNVCPDTGFQITVELLKQVWTDSIRVVLLASPSNPTGTLISKAGMASIIEFARGKGAIVIIDEIYQGLVYDVEGFTALELSGDIFVINSFSKYFGMTGWRVGWVIMPRQYVDDMDKLAQNLYLAASTPAQVAALAAFKPGTLEILEERRGIFQHRRDYLVPALQGLGFGIPQIPRGAFYIYADCSGLTDNSFQFCQDVLEQTGVAITPGLDFGDNRPERYVRFAYTTGQSQLEEAVDRLRTFIQS